jgi:hypothetical protein
MGFKQVKENGMVAMKDLLAMRVKDFELTGTHSPFEFFSFALWLFSKHRKTISYALAGQEGLCGDTKGCRCH